MSGDLYYHHSDGPRELFGHKDWSTTNLMVCFAGDQSYTSQSRIEIPRDANVVG
jgi:hypothetical protein